MQERNDIKSSQDSVWETMGVGITYETKRTPTGDRLDAAIEWLLSGKGNMVEGKDGFDKKGEGDYSGLKLVKGDMTEDNSSVDRNQELANEAREERRRIQEDPNYARELSQQGDTYPTAGSGALSTARQAETAQERAARLGLEVREAPMPEPAPKKLGFWDRLKNLSTGQKVTAGVVLGTTLAGAATAVGVAASQSGEQEEAPAAAVEQTKNPISNPTEIPSIPTTEPTQWANTPTEAPEEVPYRERLAQAPVEVTISPSLAPSINVSRPDIIRNILYSGLLFRAGQMETLPENSQQILDGMAALGEGGNYGGANPLGNTDIEVVEWTEDGPKYPGLTVVRQTRGGVPVIGVDTTVGEDGSINAVIAINKENYREVCGSPDIPDNVCLDAAIEEGLKNAGADLGSDLGKQNELTGSALDEAKRFRNWITSNDGGVAIEFVQEDNGHYFPVDIVVVGAAQ